MFCDELNKEMIDFSEPTYALYDCSDSSTCIETNEEIVLNYDDGTVWTEVVWDQVVVGSNLQIKNQSFLLAENMEGNFDCYGIWGLGFPDLAQNTHPGIIASLMKENEIDHYIFGLFLTSNASNGSLLIIGGIDTSLMRDPDNIAYFPFISNISYSISIGSLTLNDDFEVDLSGVIAALPDSGNSEITFPSVVIEQIADFLNNKQNMTCFFMVEEGAEDYSMLLCEVNLDSGRFPTISIGLNGTKISLEPEDYIEECVVFNNGSCICVTNLERSNIDFEILLGDAFLQSFYSVFDLENNTLGLARNVINNTIFIMNASDLSFQESFLETTTSITTNIEGSKEFDWKVMLVVSSLLALLPMVAFTSHFMKKKEKINESQSQTIMGIAFIGIILTINMVISMI